MVRRAFDRGKRGRPGIMYAVDSLLYPSILVMYIYAYKQNIQTKMHTRLETMHPFCSHTPAGAEALRISQADREGRSGLDGCVALYHREGGNEDDCMDG